MNRPGRRRVAQVAAIGWSLALVSGQPLGADQIVDHTDWDRLLHRYVAMGRVKYAQLAQEREPFERYLARLSTVDPTRFSSREAKLAFWINAYNACVFKGVLDAYPVRSVKTIKGFFDTIRYPVGGALLTLNEIEAEGRALGDWRIHVAVVCASTSCPPLRSEAYVPERLKQQLAQQTTEFLQDPARGLRVEGDTLWLSKIFTWYAGDVVADGKVTAKTLLPVLEPYLNVATAQRMRQRTLSVKFLDYDWSLNDQAGR